jgi:putative endopeptidase
MVRFVVFLAASTALAGCAASTAQLPPPPVQAEAAPDSPPPPTAPKPQYGTFGFDSAGMEKDVAPGDNFYQFANGTWAKNTPIPADKSNYGSFNILDDLSRERTRGLIEDQAKDPNSKIGNTYASFMDTAAIEAKGLSSFEPWLSEIRGVNAKADLAKVYADADRLGIGGPFGMFIGQDDKLPEQYALNLFQAGIGMPDRDYYLSKDPKLADTKAKYLQHLTNTLELAGEKNAAARAKAILEFETKVAQVHWTKTESRDATKTYNKMTVAQLAKLAPGFNFGAYFTDAGMNISSLVVAQPSSIKGIAGLVAKTPLAVLKDQLLVRSLESYAPVLPKAFDAENFAFYGTVLSGTPQQEERWKRAVTFTTDTLGDDVSQLYVAKYFPPETKAAADELVKNIIAAMDRRIDHLEWMSPETKVKAHAKLAAFILATVAF